MSVPTQEEVDAEIEANNTRIAEIKAALADLPLVDGSEDGTSFSFSAARSSLLAEWKELKKDNVRLIMVYGSVKWAGKPLDEQAIETGP